MNCKEFKCEIIVIVAVLIFGLSQACSAAIHYVTPKGTGEKNGTDWNNSLSWETLSGSRGFVRGDTYILSGGSYASKTLTQPTNGTLYIKIVKAKYNDHGTNVGWLQSYGEQAIFPSINFGSSFWVFDGGSRVDLRSGYGFKVQQTNPGQKCIRLDNVLHHIELSYIEIANRGNTGLREDGIYGQKISYLLVQYCYIHDIASNMVLAHGQNNIIDRNLFARSYSTAAVHSQAIQLFGQTKDTIISYNIFEDITGTASIAVAWGTDGLYVYGNIFRQTPGFSGAGTSPGQIVEISDIKKGERGLRNAGIFGNTFSDIKKGNAGIYISIADSTPVVYNNIWSNCEKVSLFSIKTSPFQVVHDFNSFYRSKIAYGTIINKNEKQIDADPFVDSANMNYSLKSGTDPGFVLDLPYCIDFQGKKRGDDGIWDRGAYEFNSKTSGTKSGSTSGTKSGSTSGTTSSTTSTTSNITSGTTTSTTNGTTTSTTKSKRRW